jgi:hypothetical protein
MGRRVQADVRGMDDFFVTPGSAAAVDVVPQLRDAVTALLDGYAAVAAELHASAPELAGDVLARLRAAADVATSALSAA